MGLQGQIKCNQKCTGIYGTFMPVVDLATWLDLPGMDREVGGSNLSVCAVTLSG